jgi:hypothetical protein
LLPFKYESTMTGMFLTSSTFNLTEVFYGSDMAIHTSYVMRIYHSYHPNWNLRKSFGYYFCLLKFGFESAFCFFYCSTLFIIHSTKR